MAGNYDLSDQVNAELECCVCQDTYREPVSLACGHSFCRECLLAVYRQVDRYEYDDVPCIDCPVCRKTHFATEEDIQTMSVNLNLRNIVTAFEERKKDKPTVCEEHKKPHVIYCSDCKSVKCLTCFMQACGKSCHATQDIADRAEEVRCNVRTMLDNCSEQLEKLKAKSTGDDSALAKWSTTVGELEAMVAKVKIARTQALGLDIKAVEKVRDELRESLVSSNVSLVVSKDRLESLAVPEYSSSKISDVENSCEELVTNVNKCADILKEVLRKHGKTEESSAGTDSSDSAVTSSAALATTAPTNWTSSVAAPSASHEPSGAGVCPFHRNAADLEYIMDEEGAEFNESANPVVFRETFRNVLIDNVSTSFEYFIVSTNKGSPCLSPDDDRWYFHGAPVKDVCLLPNSFNEVLVVIGDLIHIYRMEDMEDGPPMRTLPLPTMNKPCKFECIGATSQGPSYYVFSDANNACIHVWLAEVVAYTQGWCNPIDVSAFSDHPTPSFKMCAYSKYIYVTLHHEGLLFALQTNGEIVWCNDTTFCKPNGLTADATGIYVCEGEFGNRCIEILNHDGTSQRSILGNMLQRPWSVALYDNTLAVVERFYRHNPRNSPITVTMFSLDEQ